MTPTQVTTETRHPTASMIVLDLDARKVLLVFHKGMGKLVFPGGHVDENETPDETAVREVFEETGLHAELTAQHPIDLPEMVWRPQPWKVAEIPAPAYEATDEWPAEPVHSHIDFLYIGLADSTAPLTVQLDEVDSVAWYPVDALSGIGARAEVPELALEAFRIASRPARPPVVVLCGSTRFYDEFQEANYRFTMAGAIVLSVGFYPHAKVEHGHGEGVGHDSAEKAALDELHKRKIDLADQVYVLNVGGYIGESTRSEIDYAQAAGKPVTYLKQAGSPT